MPVMKCFARIRYFSSIEFFLKSVCGSGAALRFAPIHDSHGYAVLIFLEMSFHSILKVISKFFFLRFLFHRSGNAVTGNGFIQEYSTQKTTKGKCLYMEEGLYNPLPPVTSL